MEKLYSIRNQYTVKVHKLLRDETKYYIVMERVKDGMLDEYLI